MLFLLYLVTFLLPAEHDFKMSVCEISYDAEQEVFDVSFYLFQDDLKETLFGDPEADHLEAAKVSDYISRHFELQVAGQVLPLSYRMMEKKKDQVRVQFFTGNISLSPHPTIEVTNRLLINTFPDQTNMTYLLLPGKSKLVKIFNHGMTTGVFES